MVDDLERIKTGEGSKFNSALADLERIHNLFVEANHYSGLRTMDAYLNWLGRLHAIDRELSTYLGETEEKQLAGVRVYNLPPVKGGGLVLAAQKLDKYERVLRYFRAKKKLGIVASEDASTAIFR